MPGADRAAAAAEADRILHHFLSEGGGSRIEVDTLQPADQLLDLYGEDIRSRAYVTRDPVRGELMLRPDFTVPVASHHMQYGPPSAKYCYSGPVFRRQPVATARANEFIQVGHERFGDGDVAATDAGIFRLFHDILAPFGLQVATGDPGLLMTAVRGLSLSPERKAALLRHVWRPQRFAQLIRRFGEEAPLPSHRRRLVEAVGPGSDLRRMIGEAGAEFGARPVEDVIERIGMIGDDSVARPLTGQEQRCIGEVLELAGPIASMPSRLKQLAAAIPALGEATDRMQARVDALQDVGCSPDRLGFEASYGRTTMEYYDGFVFGFFTPGGLEQVASGGRYDLLNEVLGSGQSCPAAGGVVRPEVLAASRSARQQSMGGKTRARPGGGSR